MKKILLTMTLALVALAAMAQEGQMALGVNLAYTHPMYRVNSSVPTAEPKKLETQGMDGFKVGLVFEETFWKGMGIMMGVNYTYANGASAWKDMYPGMSTAQERWRFSYHSLELHTDWQYKFEIAKNTYVILYSGPTLMCNLSMSGTQMTRPSKDGKASETGKKYESFDYKDLNQYNDFRRLNVLWGVGAGFQYDRYYIRGGYDFGLINPYMVEKFSDWGDGYPERYTRGRQDQWQIKLGIFLWENR